MQSKSITGAHQMDETSRKMTDGDKMQPKKRCGHRKWPSPGEKQLVMCED
mgnify:CR=1 FL=1